MGTGELKRFHEMGRAERLDYLRKLAPVPASVDIEALLRPLSFDDANRMVENAIGIMSVPLGIATNFLINGRQYLVPMATEESSVIAAASKAAKMAKEKGGFTASADDSIMIGQVQVVGIARGANAAAQRILKCKGKLLEIANSKSKSVVATGLQVRQLRDGSPNKMGSMLVVELYIDTKDAMGANVINTMCETIAPHVAEAAGGPVVLRILSNYATKRIVRCRAVFDKNQLGGSEIVKRILYAYALAYSDVYRAVTHNKGVMNGIDAVALATGQDFRAIEAAAHAYAARDGTYRSLTRWRKTKQGDLAGEIELPLAVGIVGGITGAHPAAKLALQILGVKTAQELSTVMAAAGLAQNLAALRALSAEGIQAGHMRLHRRKFGQ